MKTLVQLQIEETSRRLRSGDLGIPANPEERFESEDWKAGSWRGDLNCSLSNIHPEKYSTFHSLHSVIIDMRIVLHIFFPLT